MVNRKTVLQILSIILILGGIVRLFANETVFEIFGMKNLWVNHKYFIYIYKVLGAFVILTGMFFYTISKNIEKNHNVLNTMKWGLIIVGITMSVSGYFIELPLVFYAPDFIFCFSVALYIHIKIKSVINN